MSPELFLGFAYAAANSLCRERSLALDEEMPSPKLAHDIGGAEVGREVSTPCLRRKMNLKQDISGLIRFRALVGQCARPTKNEPEFLSDQQGIKCREVWHGKAELETLGKGNRILDVGIDDLLRH